MKNRAFKEIDVYEYIAGRITKYFDERLKLNDEDLERLNLGVMVILLNTFKILLVCIVAFFLGFFKETVLLITIFGTVRISAAGIHLKSNSACTIACLIAYLSGAYSALTWPLSIKAALVISVILGALLYRYSPADTENRPILGKERRRKLQIRTLKTLILLLIINVLIRNELILNLTMYAILIQTVCVLPITYKFLNQTYNNYIKYEQ